jgi:hypothetical protein
MNKLTCRLVSASITAVYLLIILTISDYKENNSTLFFVILISGIAVYELAEYILCRNSRSP